MSSIYNSFGKFLFIVRRTTIEHLMDKYCFKYLQILPKWLYYFLYLSFKKST